jgi:hypothetical protein
MSSDTKLQPRNKARTASATPSEAAQATANVNRDEALAITKGLTDAERDLVASIVDWQIEGLGDGSRSGG